MLISSPAYCIILFGENRAFVTSRCVAKGFPYNYNCHSNDQTTPYSGAVAVAKRVDATRFAGYASTVWRPAENVRSAHVAVTTYCILLTTILYRYVLRAYRHATPVGSKNVKLYRGKNNPRKEIH